MMALVELSPITTIVTKTVLPTTNEIYIWGTRTGKSEDCIEVPTKLANVVDFISDI